MFTRPALVFTSALWLASHGVHALDNGGDAKLPVLGWNTWNQFFCNIDEDLIISTAKTIQSLGLQALGYNHINVDDCYSEKQRSNGKIIEDQTRFKRGMRNLTDQLHAMNFKAGIYGDHGYHTCAGYPGSWGYEHADAQTFFNDWNFDYLKFDNCDSPLDDVVEENQLGKFKRMADAIANISRPVTYSLCEWGDSQVWLWGGSMAQSWRTTEDIGANWPSITKIININSFITQATAFYGHNDMDMLQIGNGDLTYDESKVHFTAWTLMKSPILIGTDMSKVTNQTLEILKNKELLDINQDSVVADSIVPFRWGLNPDFVSNDSYPAQYWSGRYGNDSVVIMLLNTLDKPSDMFFTLKESPWIRIGRQYSVRDLWSHTDNGTVAYNMTVTGVPAHGVVALLLKDTGNITSSATTMFSGGAGGSSGLSANTTSSSSPSPSNTANPGGSDKKNGAADASTGVSWLLTAVLGMSIIA